MKDLCQKWKLKLIFRGAYRLSGTGIVECLEIIDVGCNLMALMAWPDWPWPHILRQIYAIVCGRRTVPTWTRLTTWFGAPCSGLHTRLVSITWTNFDSVWRSKSGTDCINCCRSQLLMCEWKKRCVRAQVRLFKYCL